MLRAAKQKYGNYVRRGLAGTVADARAMRLPEVRASLTLLWTMGGFWPRLVILVAWMAVAALSFAVIVGWWGPSGSLRVIALIGLAIVLIGFFVYMVTSPRDPWQNSWWHSDE